MTVSKEELARKRATAAALQAEWRSIRSGGPQARLEVEEEQELALLEHEITRLQGDIRMEVKSVGGTTEDAVAAMQRAFAAGEEAAAAQAESKKDPREENGVAVESETVTVNDGPPRNEEFLPFEEDVTEAPDEDREEDEEGSR